MHGSVSETDTRRKAALWGPWGNSLRLRKGVTSSRAAQAVFPQQKTAPSLGPHFKRSKLVGDSGKAMQVAVPQYGPALREWLTRDESEGHVSGWRPLSASKRCTCRAKD